MKKPKAVDKVDAQVGQRIRVQRLTIGMSQMTLAKALGVSFQQVRKYERGESRVAAGRLSTIATALGVPVTNLLGPDENVDRRRKRQGATDSPLKLLTDQTALKLLRAYGKLADAGTRRCIVRLVEQIAASRTRRY